jgi:hypothetical protein
MVLLLSKSKNIVPFSLQLPAGKSNIFQDSYHTSPFSPLETTSPQTVLGRTRVSLLLPHPTSFVKLVLPLGGKKHPLDGKGPFTRKKAGRAGRRREEREEREERIPTRS